jgi:antitoxin FitA
MSVNLSIKGVSDATAERLRQRAERNHRSLQGELMAIIEQAVAVADARSPAVAAAATPTVHQGWKTIEDLVAERLTRPLVATKGLPLAVDIVRADRDSR